MCVYIYRERDYVHACIRRSSSSARISSRSSLDSWAASCF